MEKNQGRQFLVRKGEKLLMNEITGLRLICLSQLRLGWELASPVSSVEAGEGMLTASFPQGHLAWCKRTNIKHGSQIIVMKFIKEGK